MIKEIKKFVGKYFKISGYKWKDVIVVFLVIIVIGQMWKGKLWKNFGCIDLNYFDLMV